MAELSGGETNATFDSMFPSPRRVAHKVSLILCVNEISDGDAVPQKIRDLVAELERAGYVNRGGKGSHRNFVHPKVAKPITISGALGDDVKHYQVRAMKRAIQESKA